MSPSEKISPRVSEELEALLMSARGGELTIGEIMHTLRGRGLPLVICLLCFPFLLPVPLPGLSILFGIVIFLGGLRIAVGGEPRLPQFLLRKRIPYKTLEKIVHAGCRFYRKIEKIVRPRMFFLQRWPGMINLIGATIALAAVLLALPIPPIFPLTNTIPGVAIILLALGLLERDGVLILVGYALTFLDLCYVTAIAFIGKAGVESIFKWMATL